MEEPCNDPIAPELGPGLGVRLRLTLDQPSLLRRKNALRTLARRAGRRRRRKFGHRLGRLGDFAEVVVSDREYPETTSRCTEIESLLQARDT